MGANVELFGSSTLGPMHGQIRQFFTYVYQLGESVSCSVSQYKCV